VGGVGWAVLLEWTDGNAGCLGGHEWHLRGGERHKESQGLKGEGGDGLLLEGKDDWARWALNFGWAAE